MCDNIVIFKGLFRGYEKREVMDIKYLIGEATEYDKKQLLEVKKPKSWCKSVSAFANTMGGVTDFWDFGRWRY